MDARERIPTPWRQHWREFRVRAVPALVFVLTGLMVFKLWDDRVASANIQGVVVAAEAQVGSPQGGVIGGLDVEPFQLVRAGTVLGHVVTTDPEVLAGRLGVVLAEVEMIRHGLGPTDNLRRDRLDRSTVEMNLMKDRIALASARLEKERVEREYARVAELRAGGLATTEDYDRVRTERDRLDLEITERGHLIDAMSAQLAHMDGRQGGADSDGPLAAAIRVQEERLRLIEAELMPIRLTAPIDGRIGRLVRRPGEAVSAGEPVLVVHATEPEYVVGFLPHPLRIEPEPGMRVVVRSRSNSRVEYEGEIVEIGARFEELSALQGRVADYRQTALPIKVALPPETALRPGEVVEMRLFGR